MANLINKYIWLINTLHLAGETGVSFAQISDKWEREIKGLNEGGGPLPRQTFFRWREGIAATFGLEIKCHSGGYRYYISNLDALEQGELSRWLLDTYATANTLVQSAGLRDRIIAEEIPSGREHLVDIINAMRENRVVRIEYRSFDRDYTKEHVVEPYCIKLAQKRWYLIAQPVGRDFLLTFGVDRIEKLTVTEETFILPADFNARERLSTFFGAVHDESVPVEKVVLRAYDPHTNYLRTLPLHPSQQEIKTGDGYADFELRLRPTYDFAMELMRVGSWIEVLEPQSLRDMMYNSAKDLWEMYKKDRL